MNPKPLLATALCALAPLLAGPQSGMVCQYEINGRVVISGTTADELRELAGEPMAIVTPPARTFERHWEYRCRRPGVGPCRTIVPPGSRRMIVVMVRDRVERVTFGRISGGH